MAISKVRLPAGTTEDIHDARISVYQAEWDSTTASVAVPSGFISGAIQDKADGKVVLLVAPSPENDGETHVYTASWQDYDMVPAEIDLGCVSGHFSYFLGTHTAADTHFVGSMLDIESKQDQVWLITDTVSTSVSQALDPDTVYMYTAGITSLAFTLVSSGQTSVVHVYTVVFYTGASCTMTPPSGLYWQNGELPTLDANMWYELSIANNLAICLPFNSVV